MLITDLENKLTEKGISPTAMRLRVLESIYSQHSAVSLSDLEKHLILSDRVTIYRTLKTFEAHHLIHGIDDGTGITKYAVCTDTGVPGQQHQDLHVHFHCEVCQQTICLPLNIPPILSLPEGYTHNSIQYTAKGVCAACNEG
jgi:Fur family ferric uptake transcriptional regulator